jgi:biotin transport system substrate-specific component
MKNTLSKNTFLICCGGLFTALFFAAGNVPVLSAIQIVPGVPFTMQIFLVALMGFTLGVKGGIKTLLAIWLTTLAGFPMMSGGRGGPGVFVSPTSGFIYGWIFLVLFTGLFSERIQKKKGSRTRVQTLKVFTAAVLSATAGLLLCYACGTAGLMIIGNMPITDFFKVYMGNMVFLPMDIIKVIAAAQLSRVLLSALDIKYMQREKV